MKVLRFLFVFLLSTLAIVNAKLKNKECEGKVLLTIPFFF